MLSHRASGARLRAKNDTAHTGIMNSYARYRSRWIPAFAGMTFLFLALPLYAQEGSAAIAMYGEPKYVADFAHFDYVNPDAPKGGVLKLGAVGSFDTLNPFIVRGDPALGLNTGYLSLVYEPLLARSADEPFTLY